MTRKRSLSDDERALWETVTRAVAPLRRRKARVKETEAEEAVAAVTAKPARNVVKASPPAAPV